MQIVFTSPSAAWTSSRMRSPRSRVLEAGYCRYSQGRLTGAVDSAVRRVAKKCGLAVFGHR